MELDMILMAVVLVTVIGLIGAVILVVASIVMYVPVDERVEKITGVPVSIIAVGPDRDQTIMRGWDR